MSSPSSLSSTQIFQGFLGKFHSRKLLILNPTNQETVTPPPYSAESSIASLSFSTEESNMDSNVVMVLSFLVCAVICSLVLHFFVRCAVNCCSRLSDSESRASFPTPSTKKGIKEKALRTFPVVKYSAELKLPGLDTECVICLSEFTAREQVRLLPKCNHGFHVRCIDKWLRSHSSCPKCRNCLIETCEKIMGRSRQDSSSLETSVPVSETVISIELLEREGTTRNSGETS